MKVHGVFRRGFLLLFCCCVFCRPAAFFVCLCARRPVPRVCAGSVAVQVQFDPGYAGSLWLHVPGGGPMAPTLSSWSTLIDVLVILIQRERTSYLVLLKFQSGRMRPVQCSIPTTAPITRTDIRGSNRHNTYSEIQAAYLPFCSAIREYLISKW